MANASTQLIPKEIATTFVDVLKIVLGKLAISEDENVILGCLWLIRSQNLTPRIFDPNLVHQYLKQLGRLADDNVSEQVTVESMHAIAQLCTLVSITTANVEAWYPVLLKRLVGKNSAIREASLALVQTVYVDAHGADTMFMQPFLRHHLADLMRQLAELPSVSEQIKVWYFCTIIMGKALHRLDGINAMLKIMEGPFNASSRAIKKQAHEAWIALVYVEDRPC
jgi:hypothetical protein